jgi:hypothetical protein
VPIVIVVVAAAIARAVEDVVAGMLGGLSYGRLRANCTRRRRPSGCPDIPNR